MLLETPEKSQCKLDIQRSDRAHSGVETSGHFPREEAVERAEWVKVNSEKVGRCLAPLLQHCIPRPCVTVTLRSE